MPKAKHFRYNSRKRFKLIAQGLFVFGLLVIVLLGAWQIDQVREFFSGATGEPANLRINTQAVLGPMPRPWRNLAQGGEAHDWRIEPIVPQVRALNPEYMRIDHIYDFYDIVGGSPGNLTFDFSKLDVILNDILATGAKPYIALSYMPPAIASGDIVSAPSDYGAWQQVVQRTIEHVSGTRGIGDVYYEVWNEPDLFGGWKYYGPKNYLTLYTHAALGAQNARGVQPFKIGGPGITALYKNWFDALVKHTTANNLRLDFFSWHRYNNDINQYRRDMADVRGWLQDYPAVEPTLALHITEWGHDSENHAGYDGSYSAAHTVAGSIEMVGVVDRAFIFEIQDGKDPSGNEYWGRWGMITHGDFGAKSKSRYSGLRMLDRIADQRLQILGKGTWVKALAARDEQGNTEVVISNFDPRGRNSEHVPITFTNIQPGAYTVTTEYLDGRRQVENVATTAAELRATVFMGANTVGFVELSPR